jgi:hypothetical protein
MNTSVGLSVDLTYPLGGAREPDTNAQKGRHKEPVVIVDQNLAECNVAVERYDFCCLWRNVLLVRSASRTEHEHVVSRKVFQLDLSCRGGGDERM